MVEPQYVEMKEFNGLGERVNNLQVVCAECRADKKARFENVDLRQNSQSGDIRLIFGKIDELKVSITKIMAIGGALLGLVQIGVLLYDIFGKR